MQAAGQTTTSPRPTRLGHNPMHDDVESALAEHTRGQDGITVEHTGRGLVGQRPWSHGHHDQSTWQSTCASSRAGLGASRIGDVGGRGGRTGANLENPSTTRYAQSPPPHAQHGRYTSVGDARAASGPQKSGSRQPAPPRTYTYYLKPYINIMRLATLSCWPLYREGSYYLQPSQ